MELFEKLRAYDYGEVHFKLDKGTGLRAIVAIHDTRLGPALGGCRFIEYPSDEAAIIDALRLARGMTYKAALAGLAHGGGKSVIMRPSSRFDRVALFRAFGKFLEDLRGHYITAEDSGTGLEDMEVIRTVTKNVTGVDPSHGGSGDPSPFTALGVRRGIEAAVKFKLGKDSLSGVHVAVQGVGHVGYYLCKELHASGAKLTVADVDALKAERAAREFGAKTVHIDEIAHVACDVFAPCALGAGLNDTTIPEPADADRRGGCEQSARRGAARRRSARARDLVCAGLCDQRGWVDQRRARGEGVRREGFARRDDEDLRHDVGDLRAQQEALGAYPQSGRHARRGEARSRHFGECECVSMKRCFSRRIG